MEVLSTEVIGNSIQTWLSALVVAITVFVGIDVPRRLVARRLAKIAVPNGVRWETALLGLLRCTRLPLLYLVAIYCASLTLHLPEQANKIIGKTTFVAFLIQLCLWGTSLIRYWVEQDVKEKALLDGARAQSMRAIGFITTLLLYVVILLWGLDNFGVNITALVAGLGVGGIAVALAVQNILGDLFASLTIVLDKPFVYGDYIVVDDKYKGTIEYVGLKTTRVRSLSGEQLIFPNADLLQSRIRNFKRMQERRVCFQIGVAYETPTTELRAIPKELKQIIESQPKTRFERAHLMQFGPSSLDYEVVYWVLDPNYTAYMNIHEAVNLKIVDAFTSRKIDFAYPTQVVHLKKAPADI